MATPELSKATQYFRRHFHRMSAALCVSRSSARARQTITFHFCRRCCPGCWRFARPRGPERLAETARLIRPLFSRAVAEHEALMAEAGATHYLRKTGWLKVYRGERSFAALSARIRSRCEIRFAAAGARHGRLRRRLSRRFNPVFAHAVFWPEAASVSNPLGVTRAYAARFTALGGIILSGDARSLHRTGKPLACRN